MKKATYNDPIKRLKVRKQPEKINNELVKVGGTLSQVQL